MPDDDFRRRFNRDYTIAKVCACFVLGFGVMLLFMAVFR